MRYFGPQEAAEGPALDDSLVDGGGEENESTAALTGEINMSECSVGGGAAKTASNTPAAAAGAAAAAVGAAAAAAAVADQREEPPKSPMEEGDMEEADVEEDEPSSDEEEDGEQPSLSKSSTVPNEGLLLAIRHQIRPIVCLDASSHLYKRPCPSVGWSVGP